MITKTVYLLVYMVFNAVEQNALVEIKKSVEPYSVSDSILLSKILSSVDEATSDSHLYYATLRLLQSICVCMSQTLKAKEDSLQADTNNLKAVDFTSEKDLEIYKKFYNKTCVNLKQEITNKLLYFKTISEDDKYVFHNTSCGQSIQAEVDKKEKTKQLAKERAHLMRVVYDAIIKTKDKHKYIIRKYNLYSRIAPKIKRQSRHSTVVIIKLDTGNGGSDLQQKMDIALYTYTVIDIDIIETSADKKPLSNEEIVTPDCGLQSIYLFLAESDKNNKTKVSKILEGNDTTKIYIEVMTDSKHQDYSTICCRKGTVVNICLQELMKKHGGLFDATNTLRSLTKYDESYREPLRKIRNLLKAYNKTSRPINRSKLFVLTKVTLSNIAKEYTAVSRNVSFTTPISSYQTTEKQSDIIQFEQTHKRKEQNVSISTTVPEQCSMKYGQSLPLSTIPSSHTEKMYDNVFHMATRSSTEETTSSGDNHDEHGNSTTVIGNDSTITFIDTAKRAEKLSVTTLTTLETEGTTTLLQVEDYVPTVDTQSFTIGRSIDNSIIPVVTEVNGSYYSANEVNLAESHKVKILSNNSQSPAKQDSTSDSDYKNISQNELMDNNLIVPTTQANSDRMINNLGKITYRPFATITQSQGHKMSIKNNKYKRNSREIPDSQNDVNVTNQSSESYFKGMFKNKEGSSTNKDIEEDLLGSGDKIEAKATKDEKDIKNSTPAVTTDFSSISFYLAEMLTTLNVGYSNVSNYTKMTAKDDFESTVNANTEQSERLKNSVFITQYYDERTQRIDLDRSQKKYFNPITNGSRELNIVNKYDDSAHSYETITPGENGHQITAAQTNANPDNEILNVSRIEDKITQSSSEPKCVNITKKGIFAKESHLIEQIDDNIDYTLNSPLNSMGHSHEKGTYNNSQKTDVNVTDEHTIQTHFISSGESTSHYKDISKQTATETYLEEQTKSIVFNTSSSHLHHTRENVPPVTNLSGTHDVVATPIYLVPMAEETSIHENTSTERATEVIYLPQTKNTLHFTMSTASSLFDNSRDEEDTVTKTLGSNANVTRAHRDISREIPIETHLTKQIDRTVDYTLETSSSPIENSLKNIFQLVDVSNEDTVTESHLLTFANEDVSRERPIETHFSEQTNSTVDHTLNTSLPIDHSLEKGLEDVPQINNTNVTGEDTRSPRHLLRNTAEQTDTTYDQTLNTSLIDHSRDVAPENLQEINVNFTDEDNASLTPLVERADITRTYEDASRERPTETHLTDQSESTIKRDYTLHTVSTVNHYSSEVYPENLPRVTNVNITENTETKIYSVSSYEDYLREITIEKHLTEQTHSTNDYTLDATLSTIDSEKAPHNSTQVTNTNVTDEDIKVTQLNVVLGDDITSAYEDIARERTTETYLADQTKSIVEYTVNTQSSPLDPNHHKGSEGNPLVTDANESNEDSATKANLVTRTFEDISIGPIEKPLTEQNDSTYDHTLNTPSQYLNREIALKNLLQVTNENFTGENTVTPTHLVARTDTTGVYENASRERPIETNFTHQTDVTIDHNSKSSSPSDRSNEIGPQNIFQVTNVDITAEDIIQPNIVSDDLRITSAYDGISSERVIGAHLAEQTENTNEYYFNTSSSLIDHNREANPQNIPQVSVENIATPTNSVSRSNIQVTSAFDDIEANMIESPDNRIDHTFNASSSPLYHGRNIKVLENIQVTNLNINDEDNAIQTNLGSKPREMAVRTKSVLPLINLQVKEGLSNVLKFVDKKYDAGFRSSNKMESTNETMEYPGVTPTQAYESPENNTEETADLGDYINAPILYANETNESNNTSIHNSLEPIHHPFDTASIHIGYNNPISYNLANDTLSTSLGNKKIESLPLRTKDNTIMYGDSTAKTGAKTIELESEKLQQSKISTGSIISMSGTKTFRSDEGNPEVVATFVREPQHDPTSFTTQTYHEKQSIEQVSNVYLKLEPSTMTIGQSSNNSSTYFDKENQYNAATTTEQTHFEGEKTSAIVTTDQISSTNNKQKTKEVVNYTNILLWDTTTPFIATHADIISINKYMVTTDKLATSKTDFNTKIYKSSELFDNKHTTNIINLVFRPEITSIYEGSSSAKAKETNMAEQTESAIDYNLYKLSSPSRLIGSEIIGNYLDGPVSYANKTNETNNKLKYPSFEQSNPLDTNSMHLGKNYSESSNLSNEIFSTPLEHQTESVNSLRTKDNTIPYEDFTSKADYKTLGIENKKIPHSTESNLNMPFTKNIRFSEGNPEVFMPFVKEPRHEDAMIPTQLHFGKTQAIERSFKHTLDTKNNTFITEPSVIKSNIIPNKTIEYGLYEIKGTTESIKLYKYEAENHNALRKPELTTGQSSNKFDKENNYPLTMMAEPISFENKKSIIIVTINQVNDQHDELKSLESGNFTNSIAQTTTPITTENAEAIFNQYDRMTIHKEIKNKYSTTKNNKNSKAFHSKHSTHSITNMPLILTTESKTPSSISNHMRKQTKKTTSTPTRFTYQPQDIKIASTKIQGSVLQPIKVSKSKTKDILDVTNDENYLTNAFNAYLNSDEENRETSIDSETLDNSYKPIVDEYRLTVEDKKTIQPEEINFMTTPSGSIQKHVTGTSIKDTKHETKDTSTLTTKIWKVTKTTPQSYKGLQKFLSTSLNESLKYIPPITLHATNASIKLNSTPEKSINQPVNVSDIDTSTNNVLSKTRVSTNATSHKNTLLAGNAQSRSEQQNDTGQIIETKLRSTTTATSVASQDIRQDLSSRPYATVWPRATKKLAVKRIIYNKYTEDTEEDLTINNPMPFDVFVQKTNQKILKKAKKLGKNSCDVLKNATEYMTKTLMELKNLIRDCRNKTNQTTTDTNLIKNATQLRRTGFIKAINARRDFTKDKKTILLPRKLESNVDENKNIPAHLKPIENIRVRAKLPVLDIKVPVKSILHPARKNRVTVQPPKLTTEAVEFTLKKLKTNSARRSYSLGLIDYKNPMKKPSHIGIQSHAPLRVSPFLPKTNMFPITMNANEIQLQRNSININNKIQRWQIPNRQNEDMAQDGHIWFTRRQFTDGRSDFIPNIKQKTYYNPPIVTPTPGKELAFKPAYLFRPITPRTKSKPMFQPSSEVLESLNKRQRAIASWRQSRNDWHVQPEKYEYTLKKPSDTRKVNDYVEIITTPVSISKRVRSYFLKAMFPTATTKKIYFLSPTDPEEMSSDEDAISFYRRNFWLTETTSAAPAMTRPVPRPTRINFRPHRKTIFFYSPTESYKQYF